MTNVFLFGRACEPCAINDPDAVGAAVSFGDKMVRPPMAAVDAVKRIAAGGAVLSDGDRDHLATLGIPVERDTAAERVALEDARVALTRAGAAVGMPQPAVDARWKASVPVTISTGFRPIRQR